MNYIKVRFGNNYSGIDLYFPSLNKAVEAIQNLKSNAYQVGTEKIGNDYYSIIRKEDMDYTITPASGLISEQEAAWKRSEVDDELSQTPPEVEF